MQEVIEAYFDVVNSTGGVHGRKLELVVAEYGAEGTPAYWAAQDLVREHELFALIATYLPESERELSRLVEENQLPLIGPYTWLGAESYGRYEFIIQAGLMQQAAALVEALAAQILVAQAEQPHLGVVAPTVQGFDDIAESLLERAARLGIENVVKHEYTQGEFDPAALAGKLQRTGVDAVVFLGKADDFVSFGDQATRMDWRPTLLAPAVLAERGVFDLPESFGGQVFLAYASLPHDYTREGTKLFEALHRIGGISYANSVAQIAAFSAARVFVEALDRTGPAPSRERLVSALESMQKFNPGLSAKVSFAQDRRMGPGGAYVVRVDRENRELDNERRWISLD